MAIDYSKFDKAVDLDGLRADVEEAEKNGGTGNGEFKEVPHGVYEVKVTKMELGESKKHDPMVTIWFTILSGEFKNSLLFYNQVINQGFQISMAKKFLASMDSGIDIEFESYTQFGQLLMDVHEAIDGTLEFGLDYGEKKGYSTFKITDIYEV